GEADPAYGSEVDQDATTQASTGWLARLYRPGLAWAIRHRAITIVGAIALFVGSLALTPLLKVNLLGEDGMNTVMLTQTLPVGTTLEQSLAAAEETEPLLMDLAGAETVQTSIGGDGFGFGAATPNVISYTVVMEPGTDMEWAEARISQVTGQHADTGGDEVGSIDIAQGGAMMGSNTVDVVIQGLDDEAREAASDQVVEALTGIDGSAGVVSNLDATAPALQVTIRPADAAQYGMSAAQASGLIAMQTAEFPVGSLTVDGTDLSVYFATAGGVETVEEVEALDLGGLPLSAIADVNRVEVPPSFTTRNAVRTVTVSVTPASTDDVGALGTQVAETVDGLELPEGVTWRMGGVTADMDEAFGQLGLAMLAAILLIYVVMVWLFKSLMQPLILLMSVPFAITGVILALLVTGHPIGLPSLVGLLMLIGIVVTNAIVLIDLINQYRRRGMTLEDAILRGGQNRVRPIIMTAAATITAMLPPALGLASQSSFVSGPMAISVIGGLIASTLITLIIIPVLYSLFESFQERRASRGRHRPESVEAAAEADDAAAAPA
ncbi:MAG: efflux RND transporter permease subunit, partial [Actinomycetia bacterium]|nr:efflux RND transporter permease subunit [Actinomycetes bacterium]